MEAKMKQLFKRSLIIILLLILSNAFVSADTEEIRLGSGAPKIAVHRDANGVNWLKIISQLWGHYKVHEGDKFSYEEVTLNMALNDEREICFVAPVEGQNRAHVVVIAKGNVEYTADIYEGGTGDVGAEITTIYNRDRNLATATNLTFYEVGSRTGGTLIDPGVRGSGVMSGGDLRSEEEWILKDGETYRLIVTAKANGLNLEIDVHYYENGD